MQNKEEIWINLLGLVINTYKKIRSSLHRWDLQQMRQGSTMMLHFLRQEYCRRWPHGKTTCFYPFSSEFAHKLHF